MTNTDVATSANAAPPIPTKTEPRALQVKGRLTNALKSIVWQGNEIVQAARAAGMNPSVVRKALAKPHVIAFLKAERDVFRAYVASQNIHHAVKLRKSGNAMAKLGAIKYLDGVSDERTGSQALTPGLTFQFVTITNGVEIKQLNETPSKPLIDHE